MIDDRLKEQLVKILLGGVEDITLFIAESSPGESPEVIRAAPLNDFVFNPISKKLVLWHNTGFEI